MQSRLSLIPDDDVAVDGLVRMSVVVMVRVLVLRIRILRPGKVAQRAARAIVIEERGRSTIGSPARERVEPNHRRHFGVIDVMGVLLVLVMMRRLVEPIVRRGGHGGVRRRAWLGHAWAGLGNRAHV